VLLSFIKISIGTGFQVDWWSPSFVEFNKRSQCLVDQFNTFSVGKLHVNGGATLGENIAGLLTLLLIQPIAFILLIFSITPTLRLSIDLGGLNLAWRTYKASAESTTLPRLMSEMSNDQLFWVKAAQVWCDVATQEQAEFQVLVDVHAPQKWRVNGGMSNVKAFAESFKCSSNDFMGRSLTNAACSIW
jgi:predicted metalloendopeptidase